MKLEWTEPTKPNGNDSFYNHVSAETPFGQFVITWKSWKDYPQFDVDAPFEWSDGAYGHSSLDYAKRAAETEFARRVALCARD